MCTYIHPYIYMEGGKERETETETETETERERERVRERESESRSPAFLIAKFVFSSLPRAQMAIGLAALSIHREDRAPTQRPQLQRPTPLLRVRHATGLLLRKYSLKLT